MGGQAIAGTIGGNMIGSSSAQHIIPQERKKEKREK
jgi:hypothetical protein